MDESTRSIPSVFGGRYERGPLLGRGGMAAVFRARDRSLGRDVALKLALPPGGVDEATRARAAREARVLAAIEDPRVVRVLDAGEEGGIPYLVMELIEGTSLGERMRAGPLQEGEVARIGAAVAGALAAVHAQGLVHRDVKPDNVLLLDDGEVRLVDFGIARLDAAGAGTTATAPGVVIGTPGYIAPELFDGARPDARADVYALGVTLHRAAGGAPAGGLLPLLDSMIAADPAGRPSAGAVEARLAGLADPGEPTLAMPVAARAGAPPPGRGRRLAAAGAVLAVALAAALGLAWAGAGSGDGLPAASTGVSTGAVTAAEPPAPTVPTTVEVTVPADAAALREAVREAQQAFHDHGKHRGDRHHGGGDEGD